MKRTDKQNEALEQLRKLCPKGSTVYCVLRGVSRSGMSRNIDFYVMQDNEPRWLTGYMSAAGIVNQSRSDWEKSRGVKVHGCGMDMGFHVVNNLSMALYCPNKYEHDAAYALSSRWL